MSTGALAHLVLSACSVVAMGWVAALAWRRRPAPGAGWLAVLCVAFGWFALTHLVGMVTFAPGPRLLFERVQYVGAAAIPVAWVAFALTYTGHGEWVTRRRLGALAVVPAATVALAFTNPTHHLLWTDNAVERAAGLAVLDQGFGPWFGVFVGFLYVALAIGSVLLLRLVVTDDDLYLDQAVLLLVGVAVPWVATALVIAGVSPIRRPTLDFTPYAFALTGVAFGHAVTRREALDLVPASQRIGRETAFDALSEGVLVLDGDRVVDCNTAAVTALDADRSDVLGEPVDRLLGTDLDGDPADVTLGERRYEAVDSPVRDRHGRRVGRTVVLRDVTEREDRERSLRRQRDELARLERVNAVLRTVNRALVGAATPEAVRERVAERLTESEAYESAVVVPPAVETGEGDEEPRLDRDRPSVVADGGTTPAVRPTDDGGWRAVVPLAHGRTVYGGLVLRSSRRDAFRDRELDALAELGETVAFAIHATRVRRLMATGEAVEVEIRVDDAFAAAGATGATITLDAAVPDTPDVRARCRVDDGPVDAVVETLDAADGTESVRRLDDDRAVEVRLSGGSVLVPVVEFGAAVRELRANETGCRVRVRLDPDATVRAFLHRVRTAFPSAELVRKRRVDGDDGDCLPVDLTDRQREVVTAAQRAGYFEWPRDNTAEEVAAELGVSSPTVHKHLRTAERKLVDALTGDEDNHT